MGIGGSIACCCIAGCVFCGVAAKNSASTRPPPVNNQPYTPAYATGGGKPQAGMQQAPMSTPMMPMGQQPMGMQQPGMQQPMGMQQPGMPGMGMQQPHY